MTQLKSGHAWVDIHSHVLPGIDDGCKTSEESAAVLSHMFDQGIVGVAATPHYYPNESVDHFLKRREASYNALRAYLQETEVSVPELCLGAEVAFRDGISREPQLDKLCYGNSRYLLLEMPFHKWTSGEIHEVARICSTVGLIPVIAHFERYLKQQNRKIFESLLDLPVLIQMNAEHCLGFWTQRKARRAIENGTVQVLGSDCHNITSRPPLMAEAVWNLSHKADEESLEDVRRMNWRIFEKATEVP